MKILVCNSKHDRQYFDASTPERLESAALKILQSLVDGGYVYEPVKPSDSDFSEDFMELVKMSKEDVKALPTKFREDAVHARRSYALRNQEYRAEAKEFEMITDLLNGVPHEYVRNRRRAGRDDEIWHSTVEMITSKEPAARLAVDEGTGEEMIISVMTAWRILMNRNGLEHESYELEEFATVDEKFVALAKLNPNVKGDQ